MAQVLRVSIIGSMPNGEEFSVNPVWNVGGDFGTPVSNVQAQTIATALAAITIPTTVRDMLATSCSYTAYRVEARSYAGILEAQGEAQRPAAAAGTGTQIHPFQTSLVTSLRTATPGASGRGRLYWPATGIGVIATNLRPSVSVVSAHLAGVKSYLTLIDAAIKATLTGVSLAVWSRKNSNAANVTRLEAGDVLDVQRRRRDSLLEVYSASVWP